MIAFSIHFHLPKTYAREITIFRTTHQKCKIYEAVHKIAVHKKYNNDR